MSTTPIGAGGGTFSPNGGECYVITAACAHDVVFVAGTPGATFEIQMLDSNPNSFEVEVKDGLSPRISIADGMNAPDVKLDLKDAGDTVIALDATLTGAALTDPSNGPDNVSLKEIIGSDDGGDIVVFGDGLTLAPSKTLDLGGGDDTFVAGDDASMGDVKLGGTGTLEMNSFTAGDNLSAKTIRGSDGQDTITIGDEAHLEDIYTEQGDDLIEIGENASGPNGTRTFDIHTGGGDDTVILGNGAMIDDLDMGDGADVARLGELDFPRSSRRITLDGGGSNTIDQDILILDTSWLTAGEQARFLAELEENGYVFDPGIGNYVEGDDGGADPSFDQTFTLELDSGNKIKFKDWEQIRIVCFVRGTRIATMRGEVAIEDLEVGDRVLTMDSGYQSIRWIGSSRVAGYGHLTPIRIKAGALNNFRDILVSPQHRILVRGDRIELLFGETEALVAAKHLVNGRDIVAEETEKVEYFHMFFDAHEIVFADGMPSESFHPGAVGVGGMTEATRREIFELFPELETDLSAYGPACRRSLRAFEARAALGQVDNVAR